MNDDQTELMRIYDRALVAAFLVGIVLGIAIGVWLTLRLHG